MNKFWRLLLVFGMTLSLAVCNGKEGDSTPGTSGSAAADITLAIKEVNFTTFLVPSDFVEF